MLNFGTREHVYARYKKSHLKKRRYFFYKACIDCGFSKCFFTNSIPAPDFSQIGRGKISILRGNLKCMRQGRMSLQKITED